MSLEETWIPLVSQAGLWPEEIMFLGDFCEIFNIYLPGFESQQSYSDEYWKKRKSGASHWIGVGGKNIVL